MLYRRNTGTIKYRNRIRKTFAALLAVLLAFGAVFEIGEVDVQAAESVPYSEFPASYRPYLVQLHKCYPNWEFVPDYLDVTWDEAVEAEAVSSKSLVQNVSSTPKEYKSFRSGDYDPDTNTWKVYDGTNWIAASKEAVAFYMDPRNWLITTVKGKCRSIFQFLDYTYDPDLQNRAGVEEMVKNTFLAEAVIIGTPLSTSMLVLTPMLSMASKEETKEETEAGETAGKELKDAEIAVNTATPSDAPGLATPSDAPDSATSSDAPGLATPSEASREQGCDSGETDTLHLATPSEADREAEETVTVATPSEALPSETDTERQERLSLPELTNLSELPKPLMLQASALLNEETPMSYVDMIMKAAETSHINPYVLTAFILQEQGKGKSDLISGNQTDYPGIYNYFNIAAYATDSMTNVQRGLWWAGGQDNESTSYGRPWDSPEKAILGGAEYFEENYLNKGQNTIYYKKFNVNNAKDKNGNPLRTTTLYMHQFMTNIQGARSEGRSLGVFYENIGLANSKFVFHIPVYKNMPEAAYQDPKTVEDNYLASLSADGYSLNRTFDKRIQEYTVEPAASDDSLTLYASPENSSAIILGAGTVKLEETTKAVSVIVVSDSGARTYLININKKAAAQKKETADSGGSSTGSDSSGSGSSGSSSSGSGSSGSGYSGGGSSGSSYSGGGSSGGSSGGGGGGGAAGPSVKKTSATFSEFWFMNASGDWQIKNEGQIVKSAWLCDDDVASNGQNVWYLMNTDGTMLAAGLVQDNTGNFYSLETNHNGYYGMLRYQDGTYDCDGVKIYMEFSRNHDGTFGAVKNKEAIEALKAKYGVTKFGVGNESCTYTSTFK